MFVEFNLRISLRNVEDDLAGEGSVGRCGSSEHVRGGSEGTEAFFRTRTNIQLDTL